MYIGIFLAIGLWVTRMGAFAQGPPSVMLPRPPAQGLYYGETEGCWLLVWGNAAQGYTGWYRPQLEVNEMVADSLGWYRLAFIPGTPAAQATAFRFDCPTLSQSFQVYTHVFGGTPQQPCHQVSLHFLNAHAPDSIPLGPSMGAFTLCPVAPVEQFAGLDTANRFIRHYLANPPARPIGPREIEVRPAKPVLYLYPPAPTDVDVALTLPPGTATRRYPAPQPDGQWHITAQPNGRLRCRATGTEYPSLFWETETPLRMPPLPAHEGWVVARQELIPFLENRLNEMNFTPQERAEFIQYWLPLLAQHSGVFVHFAFVAQGAATGTAANAAGTQYNTVAPLGIHPAPDEMLRVMLYYQPIDLNARINLALPHPQTLPHLSRTGFHVLEWGGSQAVGSGGVLGLGIR